ncbi:hypothetical protein Ahy_A02g008898 [Arachis hypogaea]|uniref:Thioredoxin domain-containing protein n=1 Tax=Arachis hypogaea TaxID=3818 RepID=A0A445EFF7_ARAHY|nr:hypothetical protein Ahy_A02g008898 [Arachis hypogaea]
MQQVVNPRQDNLHTYSFAYFRQHLKEPADSRISHVVFSLFSRHHRDKLCLGEDPCPVDCVREFAMDEEFCRILDKAKGTGSLVVIDFYPTSCRSCKYIEQGFAKLCKKRLSQPSSSIHLEPQDIVLTSWEGIILIKNWFYMT